MSRKNKKSRNTTRAEPKNTWLCSIDSYDLLCSFGYVKLIDNPEIMAAINKVCDIISSMTIHLMENTENGDIRVKNELSKMIDITPNIYMTRKTFISAIVKILLLQGDGNCVVIPESNNGYLETLNIVPPNNVSFVPMGNGYSIIVNGKVYAPNEVLHFVINPDTNYPWKGTGYKTTLRAVAQNLKQASETQRGFMASKWKPSVIVKADGLSDEFATKEGRKKILTDYMETSEAGEPWVIPAEQFDVEVVKPLSLTDLALSDAVAIDKKTVASILDIPNFIVGAGDYKEGEWNNFINTRIRHICGVIEQELSRKLLLKSEWYFKFNMRSLYNYDIKTLTEVGSNLYTRGIMTGNEVRDSIGMPPKSGLDDLVILENYIPQGMIGDQKKLIQGGE